MGLTILLFYCYYLSQEVINMALKDDILAELMKREFVSGEELAEK